jgi:hypothetical protein
LSLELEFLDFPLKRLDWFGYGDHP